MRAPVLLACILAAALGCGKPSSKEVTPTVSNAPANVVFSANVTPNPAEIVIEYSVRNDGDGDIVLLNRLPTGDVDNNTVYLPGSAYVDLHDDTLRISKMALPIPDGINLNKHTVPYASRVGPKQTFQEHFVIALPARVRNPMRHAELQRRLIFASKDNLDPKAIGGQFLAADPKPFSKVTLVIAYARVEAGTKLVPISAADPEVYSVIPYPERAQSLLKRTFTLPRALPALDYRHFPWE